MRVITRILVFASTLALSVGKMDQIYDWKYIDYVWPSEKNRTEAVFSGRYIFNRVLPMDVDVDQAGRIFMSFLGVEGVPATLGIVSNKLDPSGPLIKPYPNWDWFKPGDCNAIQNVYRIAIDKCNRLWVLDTGFIEDKPKKCPSKLIIFNLNDDTHYGTIVIPNKIARNKNGATLLATPVVETQGSRCENTMVYIADTYGHGLIVINVNMGKGKNLMRRLENPAFGPDPEAVNITSGQNTAQFRSGILGLAISPLLFSNEQRLLYFRSLSSYSLSATYTESLKRSINGHSVQYETRKNILPSQSVAMAFSSQGTLFFGMTKENAIACWNKYRMLNPQVLQVVVQDFERLQYLNGVKVIRPSPAHPEEELWVLSNRLLGYLQGTLNHRESNFRIVKGSVKSIVENTVCDLPPEYKAQLKQ